MERIDHLRVIAERIRSDVRRRFPGGGGGEKLKIGADGDQTRLIDRVAEDAALASLKEQGLDWNLLSEEAGRIDNGNRYTLVLDPIDGTHNAISSIPFYSTSLGILDEKRVRITEGVVINIASGDIFSAEVGKGASLNGNEIVTRKMVMERASVSSYFGPESKDWADNLIFWPSRTRYFGCISLEISLVASGSIDLFVMFGRIPRLTDLAGASLILREAGGRLFLLGKDNIIRKWEPDFIREETLAFFAVGDPTSLRSVLEISNIPFKMEGD